MATLNETMGTLPSGRVMAYGDDLLTKVLREQYIESDTHKKRREHVAMRLDLHEGRWLPYLIKDIEKLFKKHKPKTL